ncbi:hypothetical protein ABS767_02250 [Sphingomonas sp. ST-64]|uniref:Response regulatory domain-containing protein n=1 Tax=Sphingomonas plantiphila TaxID=3163295 RepID=A0ABW8YHT4_9SPHN
MIALLDAHDASRRELHLLIKGMGYDVRAHSSADALARDQRATHARWLVLNGWHDVAALAVLCELRKTGWLGKAAVIAGEQADASQRLAMLDCDVYFLSHPATTQNLSQLFKS